MADDKDSQSFPGTIDVSFARLGAPGIEDGDLSFPYPSDNNDLPSDDDSVFLPPFPSVDEAEVLPVSNDQPATVFDLGHDTPQPSVPRNNIPVRKRARSTSQPTVRKKASQELKRVTFDRAMTDQVMVWLAECSKKGLFNSTKRKDYGPAWDDLLERCQQKWPRFPWTKKVIASKYDTERRRFQQWKAFMEYSGVTYDSETGLPSASEATWEQFLRRYSTPSRSAVWLRTIPLGDPEVYRSVFFRERAIGNFITDVDETIARQASNVVDVDSDDSGRDNLDLLDKESDEDIDVAVAQMPAPKKKLTAAQQHRLDTDPDQTPAQGNEDIAMVSIPCRKHRRTATLERDSTILANSFRESVAVLAAPTPTPRPTGADDIATAMVDIQKRFADTLEDEELWKCLKYVKDPINAVYWNNLNDAMKALFVEKVKSGTE